MNYNILFEIMIFSFPFTVIFTFFYSAKRATQRFGVEYMEVVISYQWKCLKGMSLIVLYLGLSYYQGGWEVILSGVAFSASAFTFFVLAMHEMACGICISHQREIPRKGVALMSRCIIIGLSISLLSIVLIFQAKSVHWVVSGFQIVLFILSVFSYYISGTVINLIRIGYEPLPNNN